MSRKSNHPQKQLINLLHATLCLKDWTLTDLAKLLGLSYIHTASLSSGARKITGLKIEKQRVLAKFMGLSMIEFFYLCGMLRDEDLIPKQ